MDLRVILFDFAERRARGCLRAAERLYRCADWWMDVAAWSIGRGTWAELRRRRNRENGGGNVG